MFSDIKRSFISCDSFTCSNITLCDIRLALGKAVVYRKL